MNAVIKYVQYTVLRTRGPIEGGPDVAVTGGPLLVGTDPIHSYQDRHRHEGHDWVGIYPAFHAGKQVWVELREWNAAHKYSAWGSQETILEFEEGVKRLVAHGLFRVTSPSEDAARIEPCPVEGFEGIPYEWVKTWLKVEQARAMRDMDMPRLHFVNAAQNGDPGELEALMYGLASPGVTGDVGRKGMSSPV